MISFRRVSSWAGLVLAWGKPWWWVGGGWGLAPPPLPSPGAKPGSPVGLVRGYTFMFYKYMSYIFIYASEF